MKLNPFDIDIQPDELARLNTPDSFRNSLSYNDVQLSKDLPIVVKYDYIDLNVTDYHFKQEFLLRDTQEYFTMMKDISSSTINDLEAKARQDKSYHFYRSSFSGNIRKAVRQIMPDADESMIVYHFGLYECESKQASRATGERSPRVYFMLGTNGFIYPLFFDPYHELNPMVK